MPRYARLIGVGAPAPPRARRGVGSQPGDGHLPLRPGVDPNQQPQEGGRGAFWSMGVGGTPPVPHDLRKGAS